ncbi:MAG: hypothetical protein WCG80_17800 [Spirochaetales bacterium]
MRKTASPSGQNLTVLQIFGVEHCAGDLRTEAAVVRQRRADQAYRAFILSRENFRPASTSTKESINQS